MNNSRMYFFGVISQAFRFGVGVPPLLRGAVRACGPPVDGRLTGGTIELLEGIYSLAVPQCEFIISGQFVFS